MQAPNWRRRTCLSGSISTSSQSRNAGLAVPATCSTRAHEPIVEGRVNQLPISVCLIAGAEAARIGNALASVSEWTTEIIVVLNEDVIDGTDAVCSRFGARVYREPWKGHIDQKNSAAAKAGCAWILGLDSDEVVSPELRNEIERTLSDSDRAK